MIKTIFSATKGYHLFNQDKTPPEEAHELRTRLITNGFDQLKWETSVEEDTQSNDKHNGSYNISSSVAESGEEDEEEEEEEEEDHDNDRYDDGEGEDQERESTPYEQHSAKLSYLGDSNYATESLSTTVGDHNNKGELQNDEDQGEISETNARNKKKQGKDLNKKKGNGKKLTKQEAKAARKLRKQEKLDRRRKKKGMDNEQAMLTLKGNLPKDAQLSDKINLLQKLFTEADAYPDEKVLKFYDITVYKEDLRNLRYDEWLNDNNISFIYEYLTRFQIIPTLQRRTKYLSEQMINESIIMLMPTFSFLLAHHPDPTELKGVLPKIEDASFVFMPVNDNEDLGSAEGGSHWSLLLVSIKDRKAIIYDSMIFANERETLALVTKLEKYLGFKLQVITDKSTPQQINHSDCGILVLANSCLLLSRILNVEENTVIDLSMKNLLMSAIDSRIFVMGTILNLMKGRLEAHL